MTQGFYLGLMSGTSLDGVDAVLADLSAAQPRVLACASLPYADALRAEILALQPVGDNELDRAARLAQQLARLYAEVCQLALAQAGVSAAQVVAVGCHGQTVRHAPQAGYTVQLADLALLAELTGIDVVGDFRRRDLAAGGHGAPLVPAAHQAWFGDAHEARVVLNLGGIGNLTRLDPALPVIGFDARVSDFFWFAGQGGFGIQTAPAAAQVAAGLLRRAAPAASMSAIDSARYAPVRFA